MSVKAQPLEENTTVKQILLTSKGGKDRPKHWDSFFGLWDRANLIRSFLWTQEITDERVLLTQFLSRIRTFFNVDFCFAAVFFENARVFEVGIPEVKTKHLPVNFSQLCLEQIENARVPLVWNQRRPAFEFRSAVISPLSPSIGQPLGFVMLAHSVTRIFASPELFVLQSLAGELSWAIRVLRSRKNYRKLLMAVTHELKNPLQVIVGHSALLHDDFVQRCSTEQREQFHNIEESGRQLLEIVGAIVDMAGEGANLAVLEVPINLVATLREIFAAYRPAAQSKRVRLETSLAADLPPTIVTDPVKFRQIVRNLINSAMISADNPEVEVAVRCRNGTLEIVAKERGSRNNVTSDPTLYKSSSNTTDPLLLEDRGGIAWRVVKEYSDLLKGHVHAQSRTQGGWQFTVCLPCK
jgi:signal transduction histidine kinase